MVIQVYPQNISNLAPDINSLYNRKRALSLLENADSYQKFAVFKRRIIWIKTI